MLWRVCKGYPFLTYAELDKALEDPDTVSKHCNDQFILIYVSYGLEEMLLRSACSKWKWFPSILGGKNFLKY